MSGRRRTPSNTVPAAPDEILTTTDDYLSDGELIDYVFRRLYLIEAACESKSRTRAPEDVFIAINELVEDIYNELLQVREVIRTHTLPRLRAKGGSR